MFLWYFFWHNTAPAVHRVYEVHEMAMACSSVQDSLQSHNTAPAVHRVNEVHEMVLAYRTQLRLLEIFLIVFTAVTVQCDRSVRIQPEGFVGIL